MLKILEVVIGLAVVYFIYAVLVSALVEGLSSKLMWRGHFLQLGVFKLLGIEYVEKRKWLIGKSIQVQKNDGKVSNSQLGIAICSHPFLTSARSHGDQGAWQSYLPSQQFSAAVIYSLLNPDRGKNDDEVTKPFDIKRIGEEIEKLSDPHLKTSLRSLHLQEEQTLKGFDLQLQYWFNQQMDRTSGWYKKWIKIITFAVGLLIAFVINLDAIDLTAHLWSDDKARTEFVNLAQTYTKLDVEDAKALAVEEFTFPIGWIDTSKRFGFQSLIACKGKDFADCLKNKSKEQTLHLNHSNDLEKLKLQHSVCLSSNVKEFMDAKKVELTDDLKKKVNIVCDPFEQRVAEFKKNMATETNRASHNPDLASPSRADLLFYAFLKFFGFLISALLVLPGAQFWFDGMKSLLKLRTSLKPAETASDSSEKK